MGATKKQETGPLGCGMLRGSGKKRPNIALQHKLTIAYSWAFSFTCMLVSHPRPLAQVVAFTLYYRRWLAGPMGRRKYPAATGTILCVFTLQLIIESADFFLWLSAVLQIGFAYMAGILLALCICSSTSGGHFNPCVTITFVIFKGFPKLKAVR